MSERTLKPCPFCGAEPERVYKSTGQTTHIECPGCKAQFPKSTCANKYDDEWNSRVERTCRDVSVDSSTQFYCSECECTVDIPILWGTVNYCPNCGAKVER